MRLRKAENNYKIATKKRIKVIINNINNEACAGNFNIGMNSRMLTGEIIIFLETLGYKISSYRDYISISWNLEKDLTNNQE